jgi:hypothetical protein
MYELYSTGRPAFNSKSVKTLNGATKLSLAPVNEKTANEIGQKLIAAGMVGLYYREVSGKYPYWPVATPKPATILAKNLKAEGEKLLVELNAVTQGAATVGTGKHADPEKTGIQRIQECEEVIENGLAVLEQMNLSNADLTRALPFLAPKGFRPVVDLRGAGGRKMRRTDKWDPGTCEITITFEPAEGEAADVTVSGQAATALTPDRDLEEACQALAEAEIGRSFVALKWFRDELLPARAYAWATTPEARHAVLTKAITGGWILTGKVTNPRAPQYPTTTVRVNRQRQSHFPGAGARRFRPVPVQGEPLSQTILRDRGER